MSETTKMTLRLTDTERELLDTLKEELGQATASKVIKHMIAHHSELREKLDNLQREHWELVQQHSDIKREIRVYLQSQDALRNYLGEGV